MKHSERAFLIVLLAFILLAAGTIYYVYFPHKSTAPVKEQTVEKNVEIRAAIDIGSGATKLRVAEVDVEDQRIQKILFNQSFAVNYQEQLEHSPTQTFDEQIMATGLDALKQSKEIADRFNAKKVVAIATAAFRKAQNAPQFIDKIQKETGIDVYVIDQNLEGELAFEAVKANSDTPAENLIVWDIGGGSLQLTTLDQHHNFRVFRSTEASVPFKNMVIQKIQNKDPRVVKTPNPMTMDEIDQAKQLAMRIASKVDLFFREKIQNRENLVVGVGNIFSYRIYPLVDKEAVFAQETLEHRIHEEVNYTDEQLGGDEFANVALTNAILINGYMDELDIPKMEIMDINNADGAMIFPDFWK